MRRVGALLLLLASVGCAPARADDATNAFRRHAVAPTCDDRNAAKTCGLLVDTLSPVEAERRFTARYPFARTADVAGSCRASDPTCDLRVVEQRWLISHNRNVALRVVPRPPSALEVLEAASDFLSAFGALAEALR